MPNIRKRKTNRGVPFPLLERASNDITQGKSVRSVAKWHLPCDPVSILQEEEPGPNTSQSWILDSKKGFLSRAGAPHIRFIH
jgi:hypothetical protein